MLTMRNNIQAELHNMNLQQCLQMMSENGQQVEL